MNYMRPATTHTVPNSNQKLLCFEITRILIAVSKNKLIVLFVIIFGILSFPIMLDSTRTTHLSKQMQHIRWRRRTPMVDSWPWERQQSVCPPHQAGDRLIAAAPHYEHVLVASSVVDQPANISNGLFSSTTWVSRYQKGETSPDLNDARDYVVFGWQWLQLDHIQTIYTSLQTDSHTNTSSLNFYRPDALHNAQPTVTKHWRQGDPIENNHRGSKNTNLRCQRHGTLGLKLGTYKTDVRYWWYTWLFAT